jgi:Ca-activated chloride channel homolog
VNFLWPLALLGLLTLPFIILLHLLRHRREQRPIPSLLFWRGLEQKKSGQLPRHIPLSLMLLLQLFVAVVLALAAARPVLSFLLSQPQRTIFVLDMTTSMLAEDASAVGSVGVSRFAVARETIKSHVEQLREVDSFAVISLAPQPEVLLTGTAEQQASSLLALDNLVAGANGANLVAALSLANGVLDPEVDNRVIVLTDGNYPLEPQTLPVVLAPLQWELIPGSAAGEGNQALFDVSTRRLPDGRHRVFARLVNYSDESVNRTLHLLANGSMVDQTAVEVAAQADTSQVWTVSAQAETVAVEIVEPDLLPQDNRAELILLNSTQRRVLLISETPDILARALKAQPGVELTIRPSVSATDSLNDFDLIVFDGLPLEVTTWPRGNLLVVNPPLGHPLLPADNSVRNLRPDLETASALLDGIDLSGVYFNRASRLFVPDWAEIDLAAMSLEGEQSIPLVFHGAVNNSQVVVWAFDLASTNLPARLALPLLTANTLSTLLAPALPAAITPGEPVLLGRNFSIEVPGGQRFFQDMNRGGAGDNFFTHTRQPGFYKIYNENNTLVAGFAVHAGSPLESNLSQPLSQAEMEQAVRTTELRPPDRDIDYQEYWPWLVGAALLVIVWEGWLAWGR